MVWLGPWGVLIDAVLAVAIILGLFWRSRANEVTAHNAMSEVADSGRAVKVKRNPPPTRRQRREARAAAAKAAAGSDGSQEGTQR